MKNMHYNVVGSIQCMHGTLIIIILLCVYTGSGYDDDEEEEISPDLWQEACWIVIRCVSPVHVCYYKR